MPLKFDRVSSRFVAKSDPSKLPKKVPIPKNVPPPSASAASASVLGDRALLKEATTRITHDGGENPLMIGISPLPSFPPSLSLLPSLPLPRKRKWRQLLRRSPSVAVVVGGGEEVFQDCVILIDFDGGGGGNESKL